MEIIKLEEGATLLFDNGEWTLRVEGKVSNIPDQYLTPKGAYTLLLAYKIPIFNLSEKAKATFGH